MSIAESAEVEEQQEEHASPPMHRMGVALFSLAGVLISGYLLMYKFRVLKTLLCGTGSCETVQASPWAMFVGVPVPAWGVGGYLLILVLALAGLQPRFARSRRLATLLLLSATFAFGFSMYLTAMEAFRIHAWCRWCVGSAIAATLIFLFSLRELPLVFGREGS